MQPAPRPSVSSRLPRHPAFWISAFLILIAAGALTWHYKRRGIRAQWIESSAVWRSPIAEHYARKDHRNALIPRLLLPNFGDLGHYIQANHQLPTPTSDRVILYGDSITELWPLYGAKHFFPGHDYINRGVSGQATPELLWRFRQDVLDLHPGTVLILAGTNDILLRGRHLELDETEQNLQTMVEAARKQNIRVILCQLTPIFTGYPDHHRKLTREIRELNSWIRNYTAQNHLTTVDYFDAMASADGTMKPQLAFDGVHPNDAGYAIMRPLAQQAIDSP